MTGIQCKNGHIFSMIVDHAKDAEWELQEAYYKAQGCEVVIEDDLKFSQPDSHCTHCNSLEHEFENLIEKIKEVWIQEQY